MKTVKYIAEIWVRTDQNEANNQDAIAKEMIEDGCKKLWGTNGYGVVTKVSKVQRGKIESKSKQLKNERKLRELENQREKDGYNPNWNKRDCKGQFPR
jgi:hypothetical protein